jgi:hypothetical protein
MKLFIERVIRRQGGAQASAVNAKSLRSCQSGLRLFDFRYLDFMYWSRESALVAANDRERARGVKVERFVLDGALNFFCARVMRLYLRVSALSSA